MIMTLPRIIEDNIHKKNGINNPNIMIITILRITEDMVHEKKALNIPKKFFF